MTIPTPMELLPKVCYQFLADALRIEGRSALAKRKKIRDAMGRRTDAAVMQTIARRALGEIND